MNQRRSGGLEVAAESAGLFVILAGHTPTRNYPPTCCCLYARTFGAITSRFSTRSSSIRIVCIVLCLKKRSPRVGRLWQKRGTGRNKNTN
uniref:Secreted protein n=1 Tax=Knipowitschia caucasica TaxID=637954 RepID=A0AAV2KAT4_KNICA